MEDGAGENGEKRDESKTDHPVAEDKGKSLENDKLSEKSKVEDELNDSGCPNTQSAMEVGSPGSTEAEPRSEPVKDGPSSHLHDHGSLFNNSTNPTLKKTQFRMTNSQRNYLFNAIRDDPSIAVMPRKTSLKALNLYNMKWRHHTLELNKLGPASCASHWKTVWKALRNGKLTEDFKEPGVEIRNLQQPERCIPVRARLTPVMLEEGASASRHPQPLSPSPPPSPPPEVVQPCHNNHSIEPLFEEARDAFLQISTQQSNILERFLTFFDTAESRRRALEERRLQYEERRLRIEERIVNVLERLVSTKQV